ncbi:MAG TPA: biopolymer transporter ExbD [Pirellula sp.]|nr:biopolymer transporter ExbD [Pirellula sp.]
MRTAYSSVRQRASVDSMMTPMIDVVFLLLIFFLASSSFQRLEKTLPSAVASAPNLIQQGNTPEQVPPKHLTDLSDVIVRIQRVKNVGANNSVEYSMNGEPIADLERLSNRMKAILSVRADVPIVIDPDDDVPAGEAIRIYDTARANGSVAVFLVAR